MKKITLYRLKVTLDFGNKVPGKQLHRIIEVSDNLPFLLLHELIMQAFGFDEFGYNPNEEPLACFYLTRGKKISNPSVLVSFDDTVGMGGRFDEEYDKNGQLFTIADATLAEKDHFYHWVELAGEWFFCLKVEKIHKIACDDVADYHDGQAVFGVVDGMGDVGQFFDPNAMPDEPMDDEDTEQQRQSDVFLLLLELANPEMGRDDVPTYRDLLRLRLLEIMLDNELVQPFLTLDAPVVLTDKGLDMGQEAFRGLQNHPDLDI